MINLPPQPTKAPLVSFAEEQTPPRRSFTDWTTRNQANAFFSGAQAANDQFAQQQLAMQNLFIQHIKEEARQAAFGEAQVAMLQREFEAHQKSTYLQRERDVFTQETSGRLGVEMECAEDLLAISKEQRDDLMRAEANTKRQNQNMRLVIKVATASATLTALVTGAWKIAGQNITINTTPPKQ